MKFNGEAPPPARAGGFPAGSFKIAEGKPPVMTAQHGFSNPAELPSLIRQVSCPEQGLGHFQAVNRGGHDVPAQPTPSPHGYSPDRFDIKESGSRWKRSGLDTQVSSPTNLP